MMVSTPRLCNDVTFLPPTSNRPNLISCREVLDGAGQDSFLRRKAEAEALVEAEAKKQMVLDAAAKKADEGGKGDAVKIKAGVIEDILYLFEQEL